ncbi:MAG: PD40 domain-containing protein [Caulobacter sp.]|nr:PD40 domain-containing protein [Vitreoscilla sp.]
MLDLAGGATAALAISLTSDFDQMREQWVKHPLEQFTHLAVSATGDRVALTAHGHVALAGVGTLRRVDLFEPPASRLRNAVFMPDGKNVLAVSDASGENELWLLPADGRGPGRKITSGADVIRWQAVPSPDGRWIAHDDKNARLWLLDVASGKDEVLERRNGSDHQFYDHFAWSPDSQALAVEETPDVVEMQRHQIVLYRIADRSRHVLTSGRYSSAAPAFSPDGHWMWFISSRDFQPLGGSPWGDRDMGPFFDRREGVYAVSLQPGQRFPFQAADELEPAKAESAAAAASAASATSATSGTVPASAAASASAVAEVHLPAIVWAGLAERLHQVPLPAGNYTDLDVDAKRLWLLEAETSADHKTSLKTLALGAARRGRGVAVRCRAEAAGGPGQGRGAGGRLAVRRRARGRMAPDVPRRMAHASRLVLRHPVARRGLAGGAPQVRGAAAPRHRPGRAGGSHAADGGRAVADALAGGPRRAAPERRRHPLGRAGRRLRARARGRAHPQDLARRSGARVLAGPAGPRGTGRGRGRHRDGRRRQARGGRARHLDPAARQGGQAGAARHPGSQGREASRDRGAHLHLDAMGGGDLSEFVREFYAACTAEGLIIDVRDNDGGSIDSILIEKLMRRSWEVWQSRDGTRESNMQGAFHGHVVVITNQGTYSDGETFAEAIKRLKLGTVVGMRTAGAGVWLDDDNRLSDGGIARAAQSVQVALDGARLIEGVGVVPDIEVDNLPHATFEGQDAQLDMAIKVLKDQRAASPWPVIPPYAYPPQVR